MANFQTHLTGAAAVSATATFLARLAGGFSPLELLFLFGLGTFGGLLPDLDAPQSRPARMVWTSLATLGGLLAAWAALGSGRSLLEAVLAGALGYLLLSRPLPLLFHRFTRHRGLLHSLLAALFFALLAISLADRLGARPALAWGSGAFLFLGYLTHLLLDELASVDLRGRRLKRSFGTALKPFGSFWPSLLLLLLSFWLASSLPPFPLEREELEAIGLHLESRLLPR